MTERAEHEAADAWAHEIRRRTGDTLARRALIGLSLIAGSTAVLGVSAQLSRSTGHPWVAWLGGLLAVVLVGSAWRSHRRRVAGTCRLAARARTETRRGACPRCEARRDVAPGRAREHLCPRCGAHLLEAQGLLVLAVSSPWWRARRWRTAARRRLGPEPPRMTLTSPAPWLAAALLGVLALGALGAWLGTGAAPGSLETGGGLHPSGSAEAQRR
ncbi:MAG: hypothetical protein AB8I08_16035 [Sandaracinaceae bacterium]